VNFDPQVGVAEGHRMPSFNQPSPSKKLRFNHPALSNVMMMMMIIIIIIINGNVNITHSYYLHKRKIKSKILT
jgi:hypothetical protein